ncbi:glycosyltransferase family 2 protein [Pseudopedobacter beijingensis]|uniref:Glycosyltransferase n=1 Tax=Pseudopedobacter beijingensis TaxID=1207056 RepID=A0ABW4IA45_9SPHI
MAITISIIIGALLTLFYVSMVLFFRRGWMNIPEYKILPRECNTTVSIIIAARNEEKNIASTINDILSQSYPKHLFELIIVDDHSTDNTANIVENYASEGVKLISLRESNALNSYKKKAIAEAITNAKGDLIVTTDADCNMGTKWLETIVSFYEANDLKFVSSPVSYFKEQSRFEELQTLEFLFLIGLGAAGIGNKMPSTCNGANLAYRKDVFMEVGGFKGIDDLASGDDELLLHKVAEKYPNKIGFCKSTDAVVYTLAKENLKEFISQRRRWASKSVKYKDKKIVVMAISIWLFNLSFLFNFVASFFSIVFLKFFLAQYIVKVLAELSLLSKITSFNKRNSLLKYLPVLSFLHVVYIVYIGIAGNSGKYNWKGRMVR